MKKILIVVVLVLFTSSLYSSSLAIERVPKKDTTVRSEQKGEAKPAPAVPEKREQIPNERQLLRPQPQPAPEQPREGEVKKPQKGQDEGISRILRGLRKEMKEEGKERYDYFIDRNGNGIDDRLEQQQQGKSEKPPEKVKKPEERKPPAEKKERRGR